jgi:hypothetical protein
VARKVRGELATAYQTGSPFFVASPGRATEQPVAWPGILGAVRQPNPDVGLLQTGEKFK